MTCINCGHRRLYHLKGSKCRLITFKGRCGCQYYAESRTKRGTIIPKKRAINKGI